MALVKHMVVERFELFIPFCTLGGSSAPYQVFLDSVLCFPRVLALIGPSDFSRDAT